MKKVFLVIGIIILAVLAYALYQFNKPHRDIAGEAASEKITAVKLFEAFSADEAAANKKYLDKVIAVSGTVASMDTDEEGNPMIILQSTDDFFGVNCYFDASTDVGQLKEGSEVTIKGHCTGMSMDVNLIKCTLLQ